MRNQYRNLLSDATMQDVIVWIQTATRHRQFDIDDYENQVAANPFVFDPPSNSNDLVGTEKIGDMAVDDNFLYVVIDTGSGLEWRRTAIASF